MRLLGVIIVATLLSGCESLNDVLVRQWFLDHGMSNKVGNQIREGLDRRMSAPPPKPAAPRRPAPEFLDQG